MVNDGWDDDDGGSALGVYDGGVDDGGGGAWETSGDISATGTLSLNGFICPRLIPFKH